MDNCHFYDMPYPSLESSISRKRIYDVDVKSHPDPNMVILDGKTISVSELIGYFYDQERKQWYGTSLKINIYRGGTYYIGKYTKPSVYKEFHIYNTGENMTDSDYHFIEIISKFIEKYDKKDKYFHLKTLLLPCKYF